MKTQTAAPPVIPPRRPIVGIALGDEDPDWIGRHRDAGQRAQQQLDKLLKLLAENRAALDRTRARLDGYLLRMNDDDQDERPADA